MDSHGKATPPAQGGLWFRDDDVRLKRSVM